MIREEFKRSLHFMLKVVVVDTTGKYLVVSVVAENVTTADEAKVDVGAVAIGGQSPILPQDHTLPRSARFLATMRRTRYFLSAINVNRKISMWLKYWNRQ